MASEATEHKALSGQEDGPSASLSMRGRFTQYMSSFLQFFGPLISLRYLGIAFEKINPLNILGKKYDAGTPWKPPLKEGLSRNITSLGMGAFLLTGVGLYSKRTYDDMRTLYAEAVGYELNKRPEDITWRDILFKSRNQAVQVTANAFLKRTALRAAAAGSFLVPWHWMTPKANTKPDYSANIDAGVGVAGLYMSSEGWLRSQSYFDLQQYIADTAINHSNTHIHDVIKPEQIETLLFLQRRHLNREYKWPSLHSSDAQEEIALSNRIAELMNQTYNNAPKTEPASFTIGKFNYLIGFGLLDSFPTSLGFVELANKSTDMKEVNAAAAAIQAGQDPRAVFQSFGI
ncbi:MAG: hypothetical protein KGJ06_03680, partial [Pseudomonadota bacterium]|nr:hypothetical protein [Pseudomonadota bacterium]